MGVPVAVSVTDGNATLSTANFVMLSVTYGSGDAGFVVWKSIDRGPYSYDGASSEKDWTDTGWTPDWRPGFIPASPPDKAQADWLITTIVRSAHTKLLTLEKPARTSVDEALVLHDDTAALNAAVAANAAAGAQINLPCGTYNIISSVSITVAKIGFSGYGTCSIINGYGVDDDFQWLGTSPTSFLFGGFLRNIYQPSYNKVGGNALTVKFFQNFTYENVYVNHPWRGPEFFDVNDVRASHDRFVDVWGYRGWTMRMASGPAAGEYASCFDLRDIYANNLSTASPGGGRTGSYGFWIDGNVATVISYNSAISDVEGTVLEISNMVGNPVPPQFLQFSDWGTEFSNGRGVQMNAGYSSTQVEADNSGIPSPTITSGFGTGAAIVASNGFRSFQIEAGTDGTASSGIVGLPLAVNGWTCSASDLTTHSSTVAQTVQTASTTTSATLANYTAAGSSGPWTAGDVLNVACQPY